MRFCRPHPAEMHSPCPVNGPPAQATDDGQGLASSRRGLEPVILQALRKFSLDGSLVFGLFYLDDEYFLEIHGFDATDGKVTPGGEIRVPSQSDPFFIAQRY
jgi:hypothetical protein